MSCRRAFDVDLREFLARPRAPELRDFRDHYPLCRDCSAEVRAWTELDLQLRAPGDHPAPELLLRFEAGGGGLADEQRASVSDHLERCASCRDELRALRAFDRAGRPRAPARRPLMPRVLSGLRWLVWQPAVAYALVLALLIPVVLTRWPAGVQPVADAETRLERRPVEEVPAGEPSAPPVAEPASRRDLRAAAPEPAREAPPGVRSVQPGAGELESPFDTAVREPEREPDPQRPRAAEGYAGRAIDAVRMGDTIRLELPLRALDPIDRGRVEVRVLHPDGRRELREILELEGVEARVPVDLPAAWASPGTYTIEVRSRDEAAVGPALRFRAVVSPPGP